MERRGARPEWCSQVNCQNYQGYEGGCRLKEWVKDGWLSQKGRMAHYKNFSDLAKVNPSDLVEKCTTVYGSI